MNKLCTILTGVIVAATMTGCKKEVVRFVEHTVDQKVDTLTSTTLYITRGYRFDRSLLPVGYDMNFGPVTVAINGTTLFAANPQGNRVDMFDTKTVAYVGSISDGTTSNISVMVPRGVVATDQYIFVASTDVPASQVYVYDRSRQTYFGRLGTGQTDVLNSPFNVTASGKYVFVRDLGNTIKVFNVDDLAAGQSLQPFCYLETPKPITNTDTKFDMQIVGNMLITIQEPDKVLTCYNLNNIAPNTPQNPVKPMANIATEPNIPQSIIADATFGYLAVTLPTGQASIQLLYLQDMKELLYKPLINFHQAGEYTFKAMTSLCVSGETLYMTQDKARVESVNIKQSEINIYHPKPMNRE